ncbi:MAG: hypothetical protein M3Q81_02135, partial [bacterium]|nr:hypothetical protein [bacterium]
YWAQRHPHDAAVSQGLSPDSVKPGIAGSVLSMVDTLMGRQPTEYTGVGIYSPDEAFALLKTASINTGLYTTLQAYLERVQRLPGKS